MRRNRARFSLAIVVIGLLVVVALQGGLSRATSTLAPSNIAQVWANEGGDKVWRSELRATSDPNAVLNSALGRARAFPCSAPATKWWPSTWCWKRP